MAMSTSLSDRLQDLGSWFAEQNPQALVFHSVTGEDFICISFYNKFTFDWSKYNHNKLLSHWREEMRKARETIVECDVGE